MPANGRRDLIRHLKVKEAYTFFFFTRFNTKFYVETKIHGESFASGIKLKNFGFIVTNIGCNYIYCLGNVNNANQAIYV